MKELIIWVLAFLMLAIDVPEPYGQAHHFSLCPLAALGFDWCPGCGLGRSITQLFHGNFEESWKYHWFALPAVLIIGLRMFTLSKRSINEFKLKFKEKRYV